MAQHTLSRDTATQTQSDLSLITQIGQGLRILLALTLITGVLYPVVMTLVGQIAFPYQANGSLQTVDNVVIGSSLIGQTNNDPRYFQGRPSAVNTMAGSYLTSADDKSLGSSGASNLSPSSAVLQEAVAQRAADFRTFNNLPADALVPADMLFASGSGLDPHISVEAAEAQVARVAEARGLTVEQVQALVAQAIEGPQFGLFGQTRVNVLALNLALDQAS